MAQHSGFFNALESGGVYDRKYNADDYTSNLAAIISTGVRRSGQDDLKVTATGLTVTVGVGRAWIDGRWYYNDTALNIATVTPPVGQLSRKDGVYLQANSNTAGREIKLVYKTGTPASTPTAPACTRAGGIYELMLAEITVAPEATGVTVTDKRSNAAVCGWITSPVGYSEYFTSLDNQFNEWFEDVKDEVASVTLFKQYMWSTTTTGTSTTSVTFSIPQYDSSGVDIIQVYVNGLLEIPTTDYTLSGSTITFTAGKASGTEIVVICYKSIDGTGLGSVSDEVTALQNTVDGFGNILDFYYFANGTTDNVAISTAVRAFLNGSTSDGNRMKLHIIGQLGATAADAGSGTSASHYRWFNFAPTAATNRQVTLDFSNASPLNIQPTDGTFNAVFYGNVNIEGLVLTAGASTYSNMYIAGFEGAENITVRDVKATLTGSQSSYALLFATSGTFENCEVSVTNTAGGANVFKMTNTNVRIFGGTFYAYAGDSLSNAAAIFTPGMATGTAVVYGAKFPTVSRAGLYQKDAAMILGGKASLFGVMTTLTIAGSGPIGVVEQFGTIAI